MTRSDYALIVAVPAFVIAVIVGVAMLSTRCHWAPSSDHRLHADITGITCHFLQR